MTTYTYSFYLKGRDEPVRIDAEEPVMSADEAALHMKVTDYSATFAFAGLDGTFARFRASEVQAITMEKKVQP